MSRRRFPMFPGAVVMRWFLLASWVWFALPWLWTLATVNGSDCYHMTPSAAAAELRSIRNRLAAGGDLTMHKMFPEGRLFSHSFYGFTLVNLAVANPQDQEFRTNTVSELARLIPLTEALAAVPPFDQGQKLTPQGGIIPAGHANLLRAGYALLGGGDPAILEAFHSQSELLYQAFVNSAVGSVETYPHQTWPVDNIAALESLRLHDVRFNTSYAVAADRWAQWMATHLDPATGLMNMQIDQHGGILDGPRGCGLSWTLAFLPNLAPDFARQQYAIYREKWFNHPLGTTGIREFPPGQSAPFMDADTGPIIFGNGTAATGFGIAAAKANHDPENLTGLLRALELCSFPTYATDLSHSRFFGQVLLADELALWGKTLTRWDAPTQWPPLSTPPPPLRNYWLVLLLLSALMLGVAGLLLRSSRRAWRSCRQAPRPLARGHRIFLALDILTILACLLIPPVRWLYAFMCLAVLEILETRLFSRQPAAQTNTQTPGAST